ncbi:MAG: gephyrin-like molybdotransferase Glp [bacterium]
MTQPGIKNKIIPSGLTVKEVLTAIIDSVNVLPSEDVKLTEALGRVLGGDIYSGFDIPHLDNSAMDGYAVKASDTQGASQENPKILEVIEDLRAGYLASGNIKGNQAIRIMTGAPVPRGADSIVMVENTEKSENNGVKIFEQASLGEHIRRQGEDIKKGELVISKGTLLDSAHIGVLAGLGISSLKVTRKPKVAILATGDEVIDVGEKLEPGKLYSSNSYSLYSQVIKCGGLPKNLGIAKDNAQELEAKIKEGLNCDLILTSGGVSVGDYDLVKDSLIKIGTDIKFWKVMMKPGKPLVFGTINGAVVFGLPGNPVSSMVSFEIFVRSAILKLLGQEDGKTREVEALLDEEIKKKKKGLRYFLRAQTKWKNGVYITRTTGPQGSGILKSMTLANSLIILPEEAELVEKGTKVKVRFLDQSFSKKRGGDTFF